jgi:AraC-like DNA-binding protein
MLVMKTKTNATTIATWVILIARALESYGCDAKAIFARANLDIKVINDANVRLPVAVTTMLWKLAVEETGDPAFGLRAGSYVHPTNLHALGLALLASHSFKDAALRLCRYHKVLSDALKISYRELEEICYIKLEVRGGRMHLAQEAIDAIAAACVTLGRMFYLPDFNPLLVELQRPAPPDPARYEDFFGAPVCFSAQENRIHHLRSQMEKTLPTANAQLADFNDQLTLDYLARLGRSKTVDRVRQAIVRQLASGDLSEEKIADELGISLRNLQRRLKDEGTSYKALMEDTRHELALNYIKQSHLSLGEITFMLGFSETSNFSRAFKRWTGMAPGAYRATTS